MADLDQLKRALIAADKAGDTQGASVLAAEIRKMQPADPGQPGMPANAVKMPGGGYAMGSLVVPDEGMIDGLWKGSIRGANKLVDGALSLIGQGGPEVDQRQKAMEAAFEPTKRNRPISTAIGESIPGALLTAPIMGGSSLLGAVWRGAVAGAIPGLLEYGTAEERLQKGAGGAVGGAAGAGLGYGLARALTPVPRASMASDDAVGAAGRVGYKMTAGEKTGSPALQNLENYLGNTVGSSRKINAIRSGNQAALNKAALRAIGESGDSLDEAALAAAKNRMSSEFDRLGSLAKPKLDTQEFLDAIIKIDSRNRASKSFANSEVNSMINKALDLASDGNLDGAAYQSLRSELGRQAKSTTDNSLKSALKSLQGSLDDAADASLSPADVAAMKLLRKQYGDWKTLTKGLVVDNGNVSAKRLASAMKQRYGDQFMTGEISGDLMDLARIGRGISTVTNPNSGNQAVSHMIFGNPLTALPAMAANRAVGGMYLSEPMQRWAAAQLLPQSAEPLLLRGASTAGLLGASSLQNNAR